MRNLIQSIQEEAWSFAAGLSGHCAMALQNHVEQTVWIDSFREAEAFFFCEAGSVEDFDHIETETGTEIDLEQAWW